MTPEAGLEDLFQKLGEDATFTAGTLRVYMSFDLYTVDPTTHGFGGIPNIEADFIMLAKTADVKTLGIAEGDEFTITDTTYEYTFSVIRERPDGTGVSEISLAFRGKEYV